MKPGDLAEHLEHFRARVLQDALAEATAFYWRGRADALEAAMPRPSDYTGQATAEDLAAQRVRLAAAAQACRHRADLSLMGGEEE